MSMNLENFEIALDDQEQHLGYRPTASVGDLDAADVLLGGVNFDLIAVTGASAEGGGVTVQMRAADFPSGEPAKGTPVEIAGTPAELMVTGVASAGGIYTFTIGDLAATD